MSVALRVLVSGLMRTLSVVMAALVSAGAGTAIGGCAMDELDPGAPDSPDHEGFEFEPGLFVPLVDTGKADLPNASFSARPLDTSGYRHIAALFVGKDLHRTRVVPAFDWPLSDSRSVLSRAGTPIRLGTDVYEHTGLDVIRDNDMQSAAVHAPVAGTAIVSDWDGEQSYPNAGYSTVVSIWDPETHLVVQLMHVVADPALPRGTFFEVQRGQALGELADIGIAGGRHTHVNVVDGEKFELIDPVTAMTTYPDHTAPTVAGLYALDETAALHDKLVSGALDLVVTAFDRDDKSPRNLEISSVAYEATDQTGAVISRLYKCRLSDAFKGLVNDWSVSSTTIRLIDFGNATGQYSGFWPSSDLGNPDRTFRYAITNLRSERGTCSIVAADRDGQVTIADTVTALKVKVQVWDGKGNQRTKTMTLVR